MALQNGETVAEAIDAPSQVPQEPSQPSANGSLTPTRATTTASKLPDLPIIEKPPKEGDSLQEKDDPVSGQDTSEAAAIKFRASRSRTLRSRASRSRTPRSRTPRSRTARRRSVASGTSDSDEPLEDRIERAPRQRRNMVRYTRLMEDRVEALEKKVRSLEGDKKRSQNSSSHATATNKDPLEKFKLINTVSRISETEYRKKGDVHLIDVLVKDNMDAVLDKDEQPDTSNMQKRASRFVDTATTTTPERIRINCGRLLVELDSVTEQETESVFLAPFTFFTTYEQKLRDHIMVLEKRSRGEDIATLSSNGTDEAAADTDLDKQTSVQGQPPTQLSGGPESSAETQESPGTDVEFPAKEKGAGTADGDTTAHGVPQDEEEDVDEDDLVGEDILAVVEDCQVSRRKAAKALRNHGLSWYQACTELRKSMTKEELKRAEAAKAGFLLESWKTLIALMDSDLGLKMELCSKIRNKTLTEIAYEDLCYLFKPGDVVLASQDQRLQALAVLAVSGGRKLLHDAPVRRPTGDVEPVSFFHTSGGSSPFIVDCFYYDFNGTDFGAILRSITIPKYEGKTPVNNLAVYPESLSGLGNRDLKVDLVERGQKFVQLCSLSAVAHRSYIGRTLDDPPEEVDSQVIIDCHMAAIVPAWQRPDNEEWMPILGMTQPTEPDEREIIEPHANCFRNDCSICNNPRGSTIFNHQKLARQQSKDYVTSEGIVNRPFSESELREHQYMLMPFRVFGFVLRSRKWGKSLPKRMDDQILTWRLVQHV